MTLGHPPTRTTTKRVSRCFVIICQRVADPDSEPRVRVQAGLGECRLDENFFTQPSTLASIPFSECKKIRFPLTPAFSWYKLPT
jgi:hypothetical protein